MRGTACSNGIQPRTRELTPIARVDEYERNPAPMADNPVLRVSGKNIERLKVVLSLTSRQHAIGYHADPSRITFFHAEHQLMTRFPTALSLDLCAGIAMDWLKSAAVFPKEPDHDGDNEEGWLCVTGNWGHVEPFGWQAFVAVEPYWLAYGK